jgi:hypothetical protein
LDSEFKQDPGWLLQLNDYWKALDVLVDSSAIKIDRPRGASHPRFSDVVYPLDYGYLEGTSSGDGQVAASCRWQPFQATHRSDRRISTHSSRSREQNRIEKVGNANGVGKQRFSLPLA